MRTNHGYEIGDLIYCNWGYDQTNIDFYEVVSHTKSTITLRPVAVILAPGYAPPTDGPAYSEPVVPAPGQFTGKPIRKRPRGRKGGGDFGSGSVKIFSFANGYPWDGKPKHRTAAPFGH